MQAMHRCFSLSPRAHSPTDDLVEDPLVIQKRNWQLLRNQDLYGLHSHVLLVLKNSSEFEMVLAEIVESSGIEDKVLNPLQVVLRLSPSRVPKSGLSAYDSSLDDKGNIFIRLTIKELEKVCQGTDIYIRHLQDLDEATQKTLIYATCQCAAMNPIKSRRRCRDGLRCQNRDLSHLVSTRHAI
jgi:hypothetical protein